MYWLILLYTIIMAIVCWHIHLYQRKEWQIKDYPEYKKGLEEWLKIYEWSDRYEKIKKKYDKLSYNYDPDWWFWHWFWNIFISYVAAGFIMGLFYLILSTMAVEQERLICDSSHISKNCETIIQKVIILDWDINREI